MTDSPSLLDIFVRGIGVGALIVFSVGVLRSAASRHARVVVTVTCLAIACWLITESGTLWSVFGWTPILLPPANAVGGLFWLFVLTVFDDRRPTPLLWAPAALLAASALSGAIHPPASDWIWAGRNVFSGLLAVHAAVVIARGWSGDLLEGRRRLRALVLGFAAMFAVAEVLLAFLVRLDPRGPWRDFVVGGPVGGATMTAVAVAVAAIFLEAQLAMFGVTRRTVTGPDGRAEAAERVMLEKLNALMAADGWRREGLTIGQLAGELGEPEHRLRRLINQRLGHRNFAEFVNSYRIEAAEARLADPAQARTTVAAIAFDLGYGSLGPFNRAFRAQTGATPTEWRRQALEAAGDAASPILQTAS